MKIFKVLMWSCILISFSTNAVEITGNGSSSFSAAIKGLNERNPTGYTVKYTASSSGKGIESIKNNTVDFGQADAPLSKVDLDKHGLHQFPAALVAFVVVANLSEERVGVAELMLDGETLGGIYMGKITKWNDPKILALNPRLKLPNKDIKVLHRNGETGSTYSLTSYLSKHNAEWKKDIGIGMSVKWPTGTGFDKMKELGQAIKDTPYSIGYVDLTMAFKESLRYTRLKNNANNFVTPSPEGVLAALSSSNLSVDNGFSTNISEMEMHPKSWPMIGVSYTIFHKVNKDAEKTKALVKYFNWVLKHGELIIYQSDLIAIDNETRDKVKNMLVVL